MNAKIDYQTTVTNTLIADINDMANDASNYSVNPGKDFTRKRKLDSLPEYLDTEANLILTRSSSKKKRLHPEKSENYRYVCKAVTFDFIDEKHPEYEPQVCHFVKNFF